MSQVEITHTSAPTQGETMNAESTTTPSFQTKEETMSDNIATPQATQATETAMPVTQAIPTVVAKQKRNRMKNVSLKISQLRILAKAGRTREEICKIMKIGITAFENLRHKLNDLDKTYYNIPCETSEGRRGKVGKGGIHISQDVLVALGADSIFREGTPISTRLDGERIVIERADAKNSSANPNGPLPMEAFVDGMVEEIRAQANSEEVEVA